MYRTAFSYYGGKGMLSNRYPKPKHDKIIEPFAGGASYSLRYFNYDVTLYDLNKNVCDAWMFIMSKDATMWIDAVPKKVDSGMSIDNIISDIGGVPNGLEFILRSAANIGTAGVKTRQDIITAYGAISWELNTHKKIHYWNSRIAHWKVLNKSYELSPNEKATWFIDPPYSGIEGRRYDKSIINYDMLARWVMSRRGQAIVCGYIDESWIKFRPIGCKKRGAKEAVFLINNK